MPVGQRGQEVVLRGTRQVHEARVAPTLIGAARSSGDHVAVRVHRVDGIHEGDHAFGGEDLLQVGAVALAPVADEDLVHCNIDAARAEIVLGDLRTQEVVAHVGPIAPQRRGLPLLTGGLFQGVDDRRWQRPRHVADPQRDDAGVGMRLAEDLRPPLDLGEQITGPEVQVGLVDPWHGADSSRRADRAAAPADRS